MLINRKRSARRGPTFKQSYVPHDQRQINTEPTPIKDERTAQYYLRQLISKGYVNPYPYIVTIKNKDDEDSIRFEITNNQALGTHGNINSNDMEIVDIFGNPYNSPMISNADILDRVGCILMPIIATGSLGVYNATNESHDIKYRDNDNNTGGSRTVASHKYYYISDNYSYFQEAYTSASGQNMYFWLHNSNTTAANYDCAFCDINYFYLNCKRLTVLVYPA